MELRLDPSRRIIYQESSVLGDRFFLPVADLGHLCPRDKDPLAFAEELISKIENSHFSPGQELLSRLDDTLSETIPELLERAFLLSAEEPLKFFESWMIEVCQRVLVPGSPVTKVPVLFLRELSTMDWAFPHVTLLSDYQISLPEEDVYARARWGSVCLVHGLSKPGKSKSQLAKREFLFGDRMAFMCHYTKRLVELPRSFSVCGVTTDPAALTFDLTEPSILAIPVNRTTPQPEALASAWAKAFKRAQSMQRNTTEGNP